MPYHDQILAFLRWNVGKWVNYWLPCRAIAEHELGYVPRLCPVPKAVRRKREVVVSRDLNDLIRQGKVIRECNTNSKHKASVRINEALVKIRS